LLEHQTLAVAVAVAVVIMLLAQEQQVDPVSSSYAYQPFTQLPFQVD
jgi:hypothetical protein